MKSKIIHIVLFLSFLCIYSVQAQENIGIFVHGFQGSSEKWTEESLAPERMVFGDGVLDGYVLLSYETSELETANLPSLLFKFINQISNNTCIKSGSACVGYVPDFQNDNFVLIGHSLGGLVARRLYPELKNSPISTNFDLNVIGVINIGGPMQGSGAVEVTASDISASFNTLQTTLTKAWEKRSPVISFPIEVIDFFHPADLSTDFDSLPSFLEVLRDSALNYQEHIVVNRADELIGRQGSVINEINNYNELNDEIHPPNFLSIIGAEKEYIPMRMVSHIFSNVPILDDEQASINAFNIFLGFSQLHVDAYIMELIFQETLYSPCILGGSLFLPDYCSKIKRRIEKAARNAAKWTDAKIEIENIDFYWGELIDSYRIEEYTYQEYIPPCQDNGGEIPGPILDLQIPTESTCSSNPNGEWRTGTAYIKHADKSDGVVNIHSALWSSDDTFDNDPNNSYFSDLGEDGGYNHFELRNYERGYDLKRADGTYVFKKGDRADQYDKIYQWLDLLFD
jgi:hypothetical protein